MLLLAHSLSLSAQVLLSRMALDGSKNTVLNSITTSTPVLWSGGIGFSPSFAPETTNSSIYSFAALWYTLESTSYPLYWISPSNGSVSDFLENLLEISHPSDNGLVSSFTLGYTNSYFFTSPKPKTQNFEYEIWTRYIQVCFSSPSLSLPLSLIVSFPPLIDC
jgi:hypothetical protein